MKVWLIIMECFQNKKNTPINGSQSHVTDSPGERCLTGLRALSFSLEYSRSGNKLAALNVEPKLKEINEKLLFNSLIRGHPSSCSGTRLEL